MKDGLWMNRLNGRMTRAHRTTAGLVRSSKPQYRINAEEIASNAARDYTARRFKATAQER